MPRFVAFLRGVSPMNASMPALRAAYESAGFANVRTVISSGNVVFDAPRATESSVQRRGERAMADEMGHSFLSIARSQEYLRQLLTGDPFARETLPPGSKRVVTFLREAPTRPATLPRSDADAWVIAVRGREVFTAYVPSARGPAFMTLIEKAFGKEVTTRTWETVLKCAAA